MEHLLATEEEGRWSDSCWSLVASCCCCVDGGGKKRGRRMGMAGERNSLQMLLKHIRATLQDAEDMEIQRDDMAPWLRRLKHLADDIEDVLDDFEYEDLCGKVAALGVAAPEGNSSYESIGGVDYSSTQYEAVGCKIADIWRRFDEIKSHREALPIPSEFDDETTPMDPTSQRETFSSLTDEEVLGRYGVKEEIMEFLAGTPADRLSVLAIVGIGGIGKTTLAQFVYNDERVGDYFHQKIWVHVSFDFDVVRVTREIIKHIASPYLLLQLQDLDNLDVLQMTLVKTLRDQSFLLVLDDMWCEDGIIHNLKAWEALCAPLLCGGKGSKILVTTRSAQAIIGITQPVKTIKLDGLEFEVSWSLFKKHAFGGENYGRHPNLEDLGKRILKKLNGVPLAVKTIGGLLGFESQESVWINVLQSGLWEVEQGEGGILPALRLSYEHLPAHLKPCFTYCSVFIKGYAFEKLELIQLWMALGYIRPQGKKGVEDVGNANLNSLVSRSLIEIDKDGCIVIHGLLHDLGRLILRHDYCVKQLDQLHEISAEDQHKHHLLLLLSRRPDFGKLEKLQNFKKLRLLSFMFLQRARLQIPHTLFINLTCLRALYLCWINLETLPDSISNLKHLRYLNLRYSCIRCLPNSLCSLYMLQTLKLLGCDQLDMLPSDMCNLTNLNYFEVRSELVSRISGIGKLVHLRKLELFSISEGDGIKIEDLREMNELQGKLWIQNLQRVGSKEDASQANLSNKNNIDELVLEWIRTEDADEINGGIEETILEALVPPPQLKKLTIEGYHGAKFPSWMEHHVSISRLESVSLHRCQRWDVLPPLIGRLPFLQILDIICFPHLKGLPPLPTTLVHLRLDDVRLSVISGLGRLSVLQVLFLCNIQDLRELSALPRTLRILVIENLGLEALPEFYQVHGEVTREDAGNDSPFLCRLKIAGCQNLTSLGGVLRRQLAYLTVLHIKNCEELMHWPEGEGFLATIRSLREELSIENCPKLMPLPEGCIISPSLKKLIVKGCPNFLDRSFFVQLKDMEDLIRAGDVHLQKHYQDLTSCSEEALQHMRKVDLLSVKFKDCHCGGEHPYLSLAYDIEQVPKPKNTCRRLQLTHISSKNTGDDQNYSYFSDTLFTCLLRHHHLCSCVDLLFIDGMPYGRFVPPQGRGEEEEEEAASFTTLLPSLQELLFAGGRDMRRLPVETLLCHLRQLKYLNIIDCPELTLLSVMEAMQSLPALDMLRIFRCPKLSLPILDAPPAHASEDVEVPTWCSSFSAPPASSPHSYSSVLRGLAVDDVMLLANRRFTRDHLTSLRHLLIWFSNVESFPAVKEEYWPSSLRSLDFSKCPNLLELPPHLGKLVPSLEVLWIKDCPKLRCVPVSGLPPSLGYLIIEGSPGLEAADWPKVAHVRYIYVNGTIMQGCLSDIEEAIAKGTIELPRFE